jgi:AcrR family transcriptional regulator
MNAVKARRLEYVEATRTALLEAATELFLARGYAATSLDEVAARARLTKGALYHHFASKQALFEAVLGRIRQRVLAQVEAAGAGVTDPWARLARCVEALLDASLDPQWHRLGLQEAPAALGWERCRQLEAPFFAALQAMLEELDHHADGKLPLAPTPLLTRVLFRALAEVAFAIGEAPDPAAARAEAGRVVTQLLALVKPPA